MFTPRERFYLIALLFLMSLTVWFFLQTEKKLDDILINIITDIIFAVFIVFVVERATMKDHELRSQARKQLVARRIQAFLLDRHLMLQALAADGAESSGILRPTSQDCIQCAAGMIRPSVSFNGPNPYEILSFYLVSVTGLTISHTFPPVESRQLFIALFRNRAKLFEDILVAGVDILPSEVITSLERINMDFYLNHGNSCMHSPSRIVGIGVWGAEDMKSLEHHFNVVYDFVLPLIPIWTVRRDIVQEVIEDAQRDTERRLAELRRGAGSGGAQA
jgi:hypothetical protein